MSTQSVIKTWSIKNPLAMCANHLCQPVRYGHVAICVVYLGTKRIGITVLYALIYATFFSDGDVYSYLSVSDGSDAWGFKAWAAVFIVAWIGQFIGHKIEGKKTFFL
nr:Mpo1-like protein [Psychrobacter sp. JCM 18900]